MKKWYASKTLWFNAVALVLVALDHVTASGMLVDYPLALPVIAAVNMLLRAYTTKPVN